MNKLLLAALAVLAVSCSTAPQQKVYVTDVQAHRGGMGLYPEESLAAMLNAVDVGVNTLEMDLCVTQDKEVVLSHDKYFHPRYATRPDGTPDAVSAIPELDGTIIGFRAGEDNTYTLRFEYAEDNDELYIVDTQTTPMQTTRVLSGNTYTFNTSNNDTPARFLLTRNNAPLITTGNANANANAEKATKLILNQQLYIYRNGILYDATGRRVDSFSVGSGFDANANANAEQEKGGAE